MNTQIYLYAKINIILELTCSTSCYLNNIERNYIIEKIKELNWIGIDNYYNKTSRQNLLSFYFVLWKIINKSANISLINKFTFDEKIIKKINNGLQNMLWEILEPDNMEFS